ncbi:glycosyltransferase [Chryseobacterium sp.]|uniref:glycosyltransferase n=1 Tax=Chryseobacterium sp. TaxID=1871047 RepID=UPI0025C2B09D|nr:glycosyltransferase [Chryseobacterium sp.]
MNILFISSWFPNKLEPTNGNFVWYHAEAVSLLNHVEILHVIGDLNQKEEFIFDDNNVNNIRVLIIYYKSTNNPVRNFLRRINAYKLGFNKMTKPDLVHANILHNNMLFAVYLKRKYKIPFVVTEHWSAFQKENQAKTPFKIKIIAKYIAKKAEYILPVSDHLKESLRLMGIETPMKVISNTVNTEVFTIKPKSETTHIINFLHVSGLTPLKKPKDIITVISRLHKEGYHVNLEIGGDGDLVPLKKLIKDLKGENYVKLFGLISHKEVAEKMQNSDYFILFSENETQGCVILESYACGKPVIATNVGGAAELIQEGLGIGIERNNTEQLYTELEKICKGEYSFKDENQIRQVVVEQYSRESIARQFMEIYQKVI